MRWLDAGSRAGRFVASMCRTEQLSRRVLAVYGLAHAPHDGYTDLIYVLLTEGGTAAMILAVLALPSRR